MALKSLPKRVHAKLPKREPTVRLVSSEHTLLSLQLHIVIKTISNMIKRCADTVPETLNLIKQKVNVKNYKYGRLV